MDISKPTITSNQSISQTADSKIDSSKVITDIQNLKLEAGKVYTATVIKANHDTSQAINEQAPKSNTPSSPENVPSKNSTATAPSEAKKNVAGSAQQWLVSVRGKVALISSEKLLEPGQKLLLKLVQSAPDNKPVLHAQIPPAKLEALSVSQAQAFDMPFSNTKTLASLSAQQTQALIQALNLSMDKQLPLKQGLNQIDAMIKALGSETQLSGKQANEAKLGLNRPTQAAQAHLDRQILNTAKQSLLNTLTKLENITQSAGHDSGGANPQASVIKTGMLNSGLFLEKTLLSQPEKLIALKSQLQQFEASLLKTPPNQINQHSAQTSQQATSATSPTHSAIHKLQQTIESLLQLNTQAKSNATPSSQASNSAASMSDLKANLLSVSAMLNKHLAKTTSEAELKTIFLSSLQDDSPVSPFSFPIMAPTKLSSDKVRMDKQEFSAGQLLKLLAGMIHKLQFNQLHSLLQSNTNAESPLQQSWFFELPIINAEQQIQTFNFRIDQEEKNPHLNKDEQEKELQWKLLLSFDLDGLGPIYVQVSLSKHSVSSVLWADHDSTLSLLESEAEYFKRQLENIGLSVDELRCQKGQPPSAQTKIDRHLVDTKV